MQLQRLSLVTTLLVALTSCSFAALKRVPSGHEPGDPLDCTSSLTHPLVDMTATVLTGVLAISLLSQDGDSGLRSAGFGTIGLSLGLASSAVYGAYQVNRCRSTRNRDNTRDGPGPGQDRAPAGALGGACRQDGSCDEDLRCDAPMQTCVPQAEDEF